MQQRHPASPRGYRPGFESRALRVELRRAFQQIGQGSGPRYLCPRLQVFQPLRVLVGMRTPAWEESGRGGGGSHESGSDT